ncbi:MAG: CDP-alcohol phosphatidyltransferase family protein [Myxococcota bacterium]|nr:CDP-alcohol phosphatidyltransferase family protein [Myxococcota bacterium]
MIKEKFGHKLDQWIQAALPFLFKGRIDPNLLTILGAMICLVAAAAFGAGQFLAGAILLAFGGLCDLVDGVVARHQGIETKFGAFLDSTLDRLVDMAVMLGLIIHFAMAGDQMTTLVAATGLTSSILTSYTRARAESLDLILDGGVVERGERIGLLIAGGALGLMVPALWILAVGSSATVVQRFESARQSLDSRDESSALQGRD